MIDHLLLNIDDWIVGVRQPDSPSPHPVYLLLHGWTGDENSMWIFTTRLPRQGLMIAPRGLFSTPSGGYGWHADQPGYSPQVFEYYPAIAKLRNLLSVKNFPTGDFSRLNLIGFSQGAALALTFLLVHPGLIQAVAGLSGFLPDGASELASGQPIRNKRVFLAHGTLDELAPVARARQAVEILERAGAQVTYCEDDVGHKLSASCFRGLEAFFSEFVLGRP
jgi:phospholipase/carboxylesterase